MNAIIDWFVGLGDFFTAVVDFVIGFFEDIVYVIELLGKFVLEIPNYFSWLPPGVMALFGVILSLVVLYMVLNRK